MNLLGRVRDHFPRVSLELSGRDGAPLAIEFIVDTAFDGELALPAVMVAQVAYFSPRSAA